MFFIHFNLFNQIMEIQKQLKLQIVFMNRFLHKGTQMYVSCLILASFFFIQNLIYQSFFFANCSRRYYFLRNEEQFRRNLNQINGLNFLKLIFFLKFIENFGLYYNEFCSKVLNKANLKNQLGDFMNHFHINHSHFFKLVQLLIYDFLYYYEICLILSHLYYILALRS